MSLERIYLRHSIDLSFGQIYDLYRLPWTPNIRGIQNGIYFLSAILIMKPTDHMKN